MTEVVPGTLSLCERLGRGILIRGGGTFPVPQRRHRQNEPRPMECKTPVHRARYCGLFAAVGILKMPSGTLPGKIAAVGGHFIYPPGAPKEMHRLSY